MSDIDYRRSCAKNKETDHSQTVGKEGPVLIQDSVLHETLEKFIYERDIPRAVHTKGYGAFGYFKTLNSMSAYTKACFLQRPGQIVETFSRFSLAVSERATPDTLRNVRGFSTKFYTGEGNFDLLCNHLPIFLVRDGMKFPKSIHSLEPSPVNNLSSPVSFWKFVSENPEAMNFVTWLYTDLGTIDNLRCIRTYGVNTYVWVNREGKRTYVKYHWIPLAGQRTIDRQTAVRLAGENPDIAGEDLYKTLESGKTVEYNLCVQLMDPCKAKDMPFDVLDDTKVWDENEFPLQLVGRLVLKCNPKNYKWQVEKSGFSPANLVEGIELSNDKMLQGRSFIYWDAQRRRIGAEFRDIPVNHSENWEPGKLVTSGNGECAKGVLQRSDIRKTEDFFQAGQFYRTLSDEEKAHLVDNMAVELYQVPLQIQTCILEYLGNADCKYKEAVEKRICWYQNRKS